MFDYHREAQAHESSIQLPAALNKRALQHLA